MHIDDFARQNIKDRLPELIMAEDLFKDDRERARFSASKGGMFRCPVCGAKLALYRPKANRYNPWNINGFGRCPHFGRDGQYHGDTVGLYAAIHGIDEGEAFLRLAEDIGEVPKRSERWMREREKEEAIESEMSEARKLDNAAHCHIASTWGDSMAYTGRRLLEKRGIRMECLPPDVKARVGYVDDDGFISQSGGRYKVSGIVFSLGSGDDLSVQIRKSRGGRYVSKDDGGPRFISFGNARPFNADALQTADVLFITEGPFDALSMIECGASAVASIGAGNHGYILERLYRSGIRDRQTVFVSYDGDAAGENGGTALIKALSQIPGLKVFRYPASSGGKDFNDLLLTGRTVAEERIAFAKGLAFSCGKGLITPDAVESAIRMLEKHDGQGTGEEYCRKALQRLRGLWRKA